MKWLIIVMGLFLACKMSRQQKDSSVDFQPDFSKGPPTIVYKTRRDYSQYVPVVLSGDRSVIVSYPGIKDIGVQGDFPTPTALEEGYLLDNRGINIDVAFLGLTYADYAAFEKTPSVDEMNHLIIDRDPLLEICDCGSQKAFTDIRKQLSELIKQDKLRTICRVVK